MPDFKVGQTVETIKDHHRGVIKYIGPINVAEGIYLGIELQGADGKNDGSLRGERYFACEPLHGMFLRETAISRIISQPAPVPQVAPSRPKPATVTAAPKARPSSVIAPKPTPRLSTISKRQSVAPSSAYASGRPTTRNPSIASGSTSSTSAAQPEPPVRAAQTAPRPRVSSASTATTQQNTVKASRDPNVETLHTKIRHLEKQHTDDQERLRELASAKDERDRFENLLNKVQTKAQSQHVEAQGLKEKIRTLQDENNNLTRAQSEHDLDLEGAVLDKEMAEERAEQTEAEIESLRRRLEERDLEVEVLRDEAALYTAEMSEEERQQAGYYTLQNDNQRLRDALLRLKDITEERERDLEARITSLEADTALADSHKRENSDLRERMIESDAIIEDLRQRVQEASEWEDIVGELSTQNHDFQDRIAEQNLVINDLESLRELNDELEIQHNEQEVDLRAELEAKDIELAAQRALIIDQENIIAEKEDLAVKFRDLVLDLQSRMTDAESERTMTEAQVKDTASRFNEVMDLNRRLRATNVHATTKEITAVTHQLKAEEATEQLEMQRLYLETSPQEFSTSEPVRAYFLAKRITFKASLESSLLANADRQLSYNGGLHESTSRLSCVECIHHLSVLQIGTERLSSTMAVSSLPQFTTFGPAYEELVAIEKVVDQGLEALKADDVKFADLADSLGRSTRILEAILGTHKDALAQVPEIEITARFRAEAASLESLDANIAVVMTMLQYLITTGEENVVEQARGALEPITQTSAHCKTALLGVKKLLKITAALEEDSLYPGLQIHIDSIIEDEADLAKIAREAAAWAQSAVKVASQSFDLETDSWDQGFDIHQLKLSYMKHKISWLDNVVAKVNRYVDRASLLKHCVEIEHGPAPWATKAQEIEVKRQKDLEARKQLDSLISEYSNTQYKIHQREQVIATKELEIEHLQAKSRVAASRLEGVEAQMQELKEAHAKNIELEKLSNAQKLEIIALMEQNAKFERPDGESAAPHNAPVPPPVEDSILPYQPPASYKVLRDALENENHWLRQREHQRMYERNVRKWRKWESNVDSYREDYYNYQLQHLESLGLSDSDEAERNRAPRRTRRLAQK